MRSKLAAAVALPTTLFVAACGGTPHPRTAADAGPGYTKNYMVDIYTGYTPAGDVAPVRALTATEAHMLGSTDAHCTQLTHKVDSVWQEYLKDGAKGGILMGLATAVGAVLGGFTKGPTSFLDYFKYAGASGVGSGVFTAEQKREQALKIVHSYCMLQWVQKNTSDYGDRRLRDIIIVPLMVGRAKLPPVDPSARTLSDDQRDALEDQQASGESSSERAYAPVVPPPVN